MRAGFAQVAAFARDAADNRGFLEQGKLTIPMLAVGGEASGGAMVETLMRCIADQVEDCRRPGRSALAAGGEPGGDRDARPALPLVGSQDVTM